MKELITSDCISSICCSVWVPCYLKFQFEMNLFHSSRSGTYVLIEVSFHITVLKGLVNSILDLQFEIKNSASYPWN